MTLDKVFQNTKKGTHFPIYKFLKQNNPFKSLDALYNKAGMSAEEAEAFQKNPDCISLKTLNKLLAICEIDLKLTILMGEDLEEQHVVEEISDIYLSDDDSWEEALDMEEEYEEDIY
jgi:hypothetical protein